MTNPYKQRVQKMREQREAKGSPELGEALGSLLSTNTDGLDTLQPPTEDKQPVMLDTEAFVKLDTTKEVKPMVKMFPNPIGGEVIMPTGEILKITVFFPPEQHPAMVGVYVTQQDDSIIDAEADEGSTTVGFSHWDGAHWGPQFQTPESASDNHGAAKWPDKRWAALVEEHPDNQI